MCHIFIIRFMFMEFENWLLLGIAGVVVIIVPGIAFAFMIIDELRKGQRIDAEHIRLLTEDADRLRKENGVCEGRIQELTRTLSERKNLLTYSFDDRIRLEGLLMNLRMMFEPFNRLIEEYCVMKSTDRRIPRKISAMFEDKINALRKEDYMASLQMFADVLLGGVLSDCACNITSLRDVDLQLLSMRILGMSPRIICIILYLSEVTYYARISRIVEKLLASDLPERQTLAKMCENDLTL